MYYFEVCEIGRESVKSVNASVLAVLIKELVNKYEKNHKLKGQNRKYYVKCRETLEFSPKRSKKNGDDEGFESDANEEDSLSGDFSNEDAQSTTSSCCMVEDHVFKLPKPDVILRNSFNKDPASLASIIGSIDSANSSGSSDTDELDMHSLTPSPVTPLKKIQKTEDDYSFAGNDLESIDKRQLKLKKEEYPLADVIFCHTESKYPTIIAWVIKKHPFDFGLSRLGVGGVENFTKVENCLEVIVIKCKSTDDLRELCSSYQEYSRRIKLDHYHYKSIRKEEEHKTYSSLSSSKDVKVSLSDLKVVNSSLIKASELSILNPKIMTSFKTDLKNSLSLNSLSKPEPTSIFISKTNLEMKTPGNYPVKSPAMKTQSLMNLSKTLDLKLNKLSKNGLIGDESLDLGDQFNLVQRTDPNGVTHLEVSKSKDNKSLNNMTDRFSSKSKLRKEIEGVILTDVESYARKDQAKQRNGFDGSNISKDKSFESPPVRPERRKFVRKKAAAPSTPVPTQTAESKISSQPIQIPEVREKPKLGFFLIHPNNENHRKREEKIIKGSYVRAQSMGNQNIPDSNRTTSWRPDTRGRLINKYEEKCMEKRRSKSAGRASKKTPMAYRYVDITSDYGDKTASTLKRGLPSKIREVGGNITNSINNIRRRNSFDDIMNYSNHNKSNLKSVIKKNKKSNDKYCEPKKVTFSAFATVQVVD